MTRLIIRCKAMVLLALLFAARPARPYSVQTHESLIDLAWKESIRPLLVKRFPGLTELQLREAHAYAYGGCAIQDLGLRHVTGALSHMDSIGHGGAVNYSVAIEFEADKKYRPQW